MVKLKSKGIAAERELLHKFWENGWACIRVAGSGSMSFPSPDLLAGNGEKKMAFECKTFKKSHKYLEEQEISQLKEFSEKFGAEAWLAIKFDRQPWYLLKLEELHKTEKSWGVSLKLVEEKGLKFEDFLYLNRKI